MINRCAYIFFVLMGILFFASCNKQEDALLPDGIANSDFIELQCILEDNNTVGHSSDEAGTKSLINQTNNTDEILCNFLRLDSKDGADWSKAYLSEGTIATVSTGSENLRSVSLHPAQPYNTTDKSSTSRMIGWYPRTDEVPQTAQGTDVTIQYENFSGTHVNVGDKTCIRFTGLDGSVDLMVSDMREGSYNHRFNYFAFKHYLSAIRVYAKSDRSAQDLGLWGEIHEVVIRKQPTSCVVEIPQEFDNESERTYGDVVEWGSENAKFKIQKNHIFGENDTDYPENMVAETYPVKLGGSDVEKYLGYSLIQPDQDLTIQVHTAAGVYNVEIPSLSGTEQSVFRPGHIYDIHLNFKTEGSIFAYIEKDGDKRYFDLSAGHEYDNSENRLYEYKYANCYIVDSSPDSQADIYDGFCFDATVVGNGDGGIISTGAQTLYPQNAHIDPYRAEVLWQTSPRLISQIELLFGYVRFKVAKETETSYKKGNAVIAVYDDKENILWSWHIWITDTPQDYTYTEGQTSITIMDRNLGAVFGGIPSSPQEALDSYGLYYQWGRKDPSMGPPAYDYSPINMMTAPYYDYSSEEKDAAEVVRLAAPTLRDAVENPMYLIMPTTLTQTYSFNWLYEKIDFLWGYSKTTGETHKTIYDPCPYGYRVSGGELADLFTYASYSPGEIVNDTYGQVVRVPESSGSAVKKSYFFPYSGYKGVDRGLNSLICSWKYVGKKGDYQSSIVSMYTDDSEYYMHRSRIYLSKDRAWSELNVGDYTGHQIQDHTNRRTAAPVRCVKNEEHKRLMVFLTPDKYTIATKDDEVNFTLYAYAFGSPITSATLSIGYHLKNDPDTHQEYEVKSWNSIGSASIWNHVYNYDFSFIKDTIGERLDIDDTTGEFRFILTVKSADNINKMSSTTIRLEKMNIEFLNWEDEETFFAGTDIDKRFRIYGDSEITSVQIMQKGASGDQALMTVSMQANSGSDYAYDYNGSTKGLKFNAAGTYEVYLKIILKNGQELLSETKTFDIRASEWTEVTSLNQLNDADEYLIMNVTSGGYAYDNGTYPYAKAVYDASCYFKLFKQNGSNYKIQNISTGDYANTNTYILMMSADEGDATQFVIEYNATYHYFTFRVKVKASQYYWQQIQGADQITLSSYRNDLPEIMRWKIYKKASSD